MAYSFLWATLCFRAGLIVHDAAAESHSRSAPPPTTFAAYGDMPYRIRLPDGRTDELVLMQDIAPKIRGRADIPFVIHVGDVGRPEFACSDAWLEQTRLFWKIQLIKPVFYTPGDNEWKDCDRPGLATRSKALDRLEAIRRIFFGEPRALGTEWRYEEQPDQPENATWWHKHIRFVTQHIVSQDNGRKDIFLDDPMQAIQLVEERDARNQIWLEHAFAKARDEGAVALVVAMQADPFGEPDGKSDAMSRCANKPAYRAFCTRLQSLAAKLDKPVLLIHGDTNAYCLDQPFAATQASNLWRLNAPGDYKVIDAALIEFDSANTIRPFKVTGLLSGEVAPTFCDYSR